MKITKELRNLGAAEIQKRLQEFKKELLKLKSGSQTGNAGKIKMNKKNIARIETILSEKRGAKK